MVSYFNIGTILNQWEYAGFFDYLLPFLFVFAVVYGILSYGKIFGEHKGVHIIVSFAVGLMALQWRGYIEFTKEIFPQLGIALSVVLVAWILISLFVSDQDRKYFAYGLVVLAIISFLIILYNSFNNLGLIEYGEFIEENIGYIVGAILVVGLIIAITSSTGSKSSSRTNSSYGPWFLLPSKDK